MSSAYSIVPNTSVTVNTGDVSRNCIITFSTEVSTSIADTTVLNYTIDSTNPANCQVIGPEIFDTGTGSFRTVTQMGVKNIGPGTHIIRPCFAVVDQNGGLLSTVFGDRCLTVECRTQ